MKKRNPWAWIPTLYFPVVIVLSVIVTGLFYGVFRWKTWI